MKKKQHEEISDFLTPIEAFNINENEEFSCFVLEKKFGI